MRLILDPPRSAALNMAIDEALMRRAGGEPVLRVYSWDVPSCSVGYFQDLADVTMRLKLREKGIPAVRRITGGGLVLHGDDVTFSLTVKTPSEFMPADVKSSYLKVNEALRAGLGALLPDIDYADCKSVPSGRGKGDRVCFEAPACYDLLVRGRKVVGASQRRIGGAALHQSSVFAGRDRRAVERAIVKGFESKWNASFREAPLSGPELEEARRIQAERYADAAWLSPSSATRV